MDELTREFLIESQEGLDRMERCLTDLEARPGDTALLAEIFRTVHTIKGTTGFLGFGRLEKLAHAGENLLGMVREGRLAASGAVITELLRLLDALRSILRSIESGGNEGEGSDETLIGRLEDLQGSAPETRKRPSRARSGTLPPRTSRSAKTAAAVMESAEPAPAREQGAPAPAAPQPNFAAESTLRVDVALLNRLMNLVGELVLTRNQLLQATACDPRMTLVSRRLDMVTADLREAVMKARMQPVSNVFSKMPRMVRDLAQTLDRRVRLRMEGQETELDRSLLEAIKDPLTHAVRNALDHGVEPPAARAAAGKDPEGALTLRAMQVGSHVVIEIADDGAGIPVDKVRDKAIERGLISAENAAALPERELLQLIFLPGFSTAAAVTTVSGRGVGMDVVRTNVEKIGGKVEIDSRAGEGTTMRLRIPLTLAIIPALIVRSAGQSFALPQGAISEFVRLAHGDASRLIEWIGDAPLLRLRGTLLPLVFLNRILELNGVPEPDPTPPRESGGSGADRPRFIAVIEVDGRRFGLVVDGLADPEEIVVKPLHAALKGIGLYAGATVLGNGEMALILDPGAIAVRARVAQSSEASETAAGPAEPGMDRATEYLVVDASGRHAAVLLRDVLRIERIPSSRIERVGAQLVLHAGGVLLPVQNICAACDVGKDDPAAPVIVVVCRRGEREVGVLVSRVLEVTKGAGLVEAGTGNAAEGVTLLRDRLTGIVDLQALSADVPDAVTLRDELETVR